MKCLGFYSYFGLHSPIQRRIDMRVVRKKRHAYYSQPVREGNQAFPVFEGLKNTSPKDKILNPIVQENLDVLENNEEQKSSQKVLKKQCK